MSDLSKELALFRQMAAAVGTLEEPTEAEVDEHLRADGIDPERSVARILAKIRKSTWLDSAGRRLASRSGEAVVIDPRLLSMSRGQMLGLAQRSPGVSAQFQKLDGFTDDDLRRLLSRLEVLDVE